ncbi:amidohydrolase family protein [Naumannella sp. ID2617S]|nr:amidohydrolase family protein [Naumannella sp. ID2617S]
MLRERIGTDIIAWECDYPHTDTTWPESPEFAWKELTDAGCSDEDIHKITWQNTARFFDWDPFQHNKKEESTVGALRSRATDVDTTGMSRAEWKSKNEAEGVGVFA